MGTINDRVQKPETDKKKTRKFDYLISFRCDCERRNIAQVANSPLSLKMKLFCDASLVTIQETSS